MVNSFGTFYSIPNNLKVNLNSFKPTCLPGQITLGSLFMLFDSFLGIKTLCCADEDEGGACST